MSLSKFYTKNKLLQHILFWIVLFCVYVLSYSGKAENFKYFALNNGTKFPFYMAAAYSLNYWLVPQFLSKKKYTLFALGLVLSSFMIVLSFKYMLHLQFDYEMHTFNILSYLSKTLMFYTPALLMYVYQSYLRQQQEKDRLLHLQQEKLDTELKYLKAQLHPHFLFNTLNNIYSFVLNNSPKAGDMILQLSEILDYTLYKSQANLVSLKEEINCIKNYINLEKTRYGNRLKVSVNIPDNLVGKEITPLLLLSIVENAFKHGASGSISNPEIKITLNVDENKLCFNVWNTKEENHSHVKTDSYKEGIGLQNIKKQLNLVYPNSHEFVIENEKEYFNFNLTIKET